MKLRNILLLTAMGLLFSSTLWASTTNVAVLPAGAHIVPGDPSQDEFFIVGKNDIVPPVLESEDGYATKIKVAYAKAVQPPAKKIMPVVLAAKKPKPVIVVVKAYPEMDVVINLQGDEPFIKPHMLEQLIAPFLAGENPDMTTLAYPLEKDKYHAPGSVKVITDLQQNAIYFSRAPIPYFRTEHKAPVYNHMGLYAFKRDFLMLYQKLAQTPLELTESLEQLRVLEHGYKIRVCLTEEKTLEINTPEEYELAQNYSYND